MSSSICGATEQIFLIFLEGTGNQAGCSFQTGKWARENIPHSTRKQAGENMPLSDMEVDGENIYHSNFGKSKLERLSPFSDQEVGWKEQNFALGGSLERTCPFQTERQAGENIPRSNKEVVQRETVPLRGRKRVPFEQESRLERACQFSDQEVGQKGRVPFRLWRGLERTCPVVEVRP